MRVLVRVPEAYLLLRPFDTVRPGLLVLDADGRRVASIPLTGKPEPASVADALAKALETAPRERVLVRAPAKAAEDVARRLGAIEGAERAEAWVGGFVEVWCAPGAVTPDGVAGIAKASGQEIELIDPVRVRLEAARKGVDIPAALAKVAGTRHTSITKKGSVAWISRWLLSPSRLGAVGLEGDVAGVVYRFEDLPKGAPVVPHLMRPFSQKGVLAVVPRVADGVIELVVRPALHDAEQTLAALKAGGLTPSPK